VKYEYIHSLTARRLYSCTASPYSHTGLTIAYLSSFTPSDTPPITTMNIEMLGAAANFGGSSSCHCENFDWGLIVTAGERALQQQNYRCTIKSTSSGTWACMQIDLVQSSEDKPVTCDQVTSALFCLPQKVCPHEYTAYVVDKLRPRQRF
jgi:hypothetical protein